MKRSFDSVCRRPALKEGKRVNLVLEIDRMALLDRLGEKALQSSGGESRIASGAVRVRVEAQ